MEKEFRVVGQPNKLTGNKVVQLTYLPDDEYDKLLNKSLVFLCMYEHRQIMQLSNALTLALLLLHIAILPLKSM